jgi:hypothetical protein
LSLSRKGAEKEKTQEKGKKNIRACRSGLRLSLVLSRKGERREQKVKSGMARFTDFLLNPQCVVGVVSVSVPFFAYLPATCRYVNFSTRAQACLL